MLLADGCTGAGKSYTMMGGGRDEGGGAHNGICARALRDIFREASRRRKMGNVISVQVSHIYDCNEVHDKNSIFIMFTTVCVMFPVATFNGRALYHLCLIDDRPKLSIRITDRVFVPNAGTAATMHLCTDYVYIFPAVWPGITLSFQYTPLQAYKYDTTSFTVVTVCNSICHLDTAERSSYCHPSLQSPTSPFFCCSFSCFALLYITGTY